MLKDTMDGVVVGTVKIIGVACGLGVVGAWLYVVAHLLLKYW